MNLKTYDFPEISQSKMAFSTLKTDMKLLAEAQARGFDDSHNPYVKLFNTLFFVGGRIKFKEGLDPDFKKKAYAYLLAFMRSFEPKHEHKQAISAMILSEPVEPTLG